jgi:hypothetical protein
MQSFVILSLPHNRYFILVILRLPNSGYSTPPQFRLFYAPPIPVILRLDRGIHLLLPLFIIIRLVYSSR